MDEPATNTTSRVVTGTIARRIVVVVVASVATIAAALFVAGALAAFAQRRVPDLSLFYATASPEHQDDALRRL
jgi:hypothetical protein